jgi:hypothetical protein
MNKRYSEEERQRHLNACEKSGLSILEYSKRNDLSPGIISFWRRRQQKLSIGKFEEILLPGAPYGSLIIEYPTGIKIHLDSAVDISVIKALLHC